ncbi:MAG: hypothetical protein JW767_01180 [Thermoleophilia bacterium]|nr:hypothetical protein [Thermoleophilia bacterium]
MRIVVIIVFTLSLAVVAGAAVVAARGGAALEGAGGGPALEGAGGGPAPTRAAVVVAGPGEDAATKARATALAIVKDIAREITAEMGDAHERLVERGKRKGEDYRLWRDYLDRVRARYGVTSVYTMVKLDRETAGVVVEAVGDPDAADAWLAAYELEPAMKRAFRGRAAARKDAPWFDPRIRGGAPHVRALAPVRDSDDEVVAIVGVDVEVGDRRVTR